MKMDEQIKQWAKICESYDQNNDKDNGLNDPSILIKFIESYPQHEDCIYKDSNGWNVTDEWLVGTFAGRGWTGDTKEDAARQMIEYLNKHIGHKSIVGVAVSESGWPNVNNVKHYIDSAIQSQEEYDSEI